MLFFSSSPIKNFILFVLVLFVGGLIFWQWFKLPQSYSDKGSEASSWDQFNNQVSTAIDRVSGQIELGQAEGKQTWEEYQRQQKEKELIDNIKTYLENSSSTDATSTEENIDNR